MAHRFDELVPLQFVCLETYSSPEFFFFLASTFFQVFSFFIRVHLLPSLLLLHS
ncbi:hypothetical protein AVEN_200099-1, partial [Araneus ventricosus]